MARCATGLDRLAAGEAEVARLVRGRRIGLVAHPASVDAGFTHAKDVLVRAGAKLCALFGPEHGYGGEAQDMTGVAELRDPETGAQIRSLYGATEADLSPRREWLEGLDAIVVDLQDVGSRYYTFVWTAALVLRAAAAAGVETIVLDRPNPLGGEVVEGAPQRSGYRSFVGLYDVAVRHGMTIGELCSMVCERERLDASALRVVELRGWTRAMHFVETELPWVLPSPNMPTPETALVYPGGCLLEGTNLSEGRGTTRPFELWGAPFVDGRSLADAVSGAGARLRPLTFEPTFHKHAKQRCGGVQVHVTDARGLRSYALYLRAIAHVRAVAGGAFRWRTETYEYVSDRPAIDLLTGGPEYRAAADAGDAAALERVLEAEDAGAARFARERAAWLRYA
jgi:uncharacterized protein YbbC (DUF1343 family)